MNGKRFSKKSKRDSLKKFFLRNSNAISKFFYDFDKYRKRNRVLILAIIVISIIMLSWFFVSEINQSSATPAVEDIP